MDHCTILNILLDNPEELDLKHKPSAIREDKIFTLDQRVIPIASAEADDNEHTFQKEMQSTTTNTAVPLGLAQSIWKMGCSLPIEKQQKATKRIMFRRRRFMNLPDITKRTKPTRHFQGLLSQSKQSMNESQNLGVWSCISGQVELKSLSCSAMVTP